MNMRHARRGKPARPDTKLWAPVTIAILGHRSAGKTSLAELLLQTARVTRTVGSVDQGTSLLDWSPLARRHRMTCRLATAWFDHAERAMVLVDTPGTSGLRHEQALAHHVADAAILVADAGEGVQLGTTLPADRAEPRPVFAVVTKLDRLTHRDPEGLQPIVAALDERVGGRVVPLQLPWFDPDGSLQGLLDVLGQRALRYADDASGLFSPEPLPPAQIPVVALARERLAEAVALTDDALLDQYLEDLELDHSSLTQGLSRAIASGAIVPLMLSSAAAHVGAGPLLDGLAAWCPAARPARVRDADGGVGELPASGRFVAEVVARQRDGDGQPVTWLKIWSGVAGRGEWRTADGRSVRVQKLYRIRGPRRATVAAPAAGALVATWEAADLPIGTTLTDGAACTVVRPQPPPPQVTWVLAGAHRERLHQEVQAVAAEDEALVFTEGDGAICLGGVSEAHLRMAVELIEERVGFEVLVDVPPVQYREVPRGRIADVEATHELRGAHGLATEYARCVLSVGPRPMNGGVAGLQFSDASSIDEEDLPERFRPAIREGCERALGRGPTAGFPVIGVDVELTGGDYNAMCSTEEHFFEAGSRGLRAALERCGTMLVEPWHEIRVECPQDVVGEVMSDLSAHRGRVRGLEVQSDVATIEATAPFRELRRYGPRLDALTSGRGRFYTGKERFEPVPDELVDEAIGSSRGG